MGLKDQISGSHGTQLNLIHCMEKCIAAGHTLQPLLKPRLAADPLDIAMHHDRAVLALGPAQGDG